MLSNQVLAFGNNEVRILHELQLFEAVVLLKSHALTDQLQEIDDAKRPVAFVRTEFAMVGVVDRDQGVDAGATCRLELVALELAFITWEDAEVDALQADRRLLQVDELHAGNGMQDFGGRFHHTGHAWMLVQGDA